MEGPEPDIPEPKAPFSIAVCLIKSKPESNRAQRLYNFVMQRAAYQVVIRVNQRLIRLHFPLYYGALRK
jgi:hypothetical protein